MENKREQAKAYVMNEKHTDIVICIDQGAEVPTINAVKEMIKDFCLKYKEAYEGGDKSHLHIRLKLIVFGDFAYENALTETDFFALPEQMSELWCFLDTISRIPGGDEPQNSLEAIALAIRSDWLAGDLIRRYIIVFTEASAHPLGKRASYPSYPEGMPKDLDELVAWFEGTDGTRVGTYDPKRANLLCLCPKDYPWNSDLLDKCIKYTPIFMYRGPGAFGNEVDFGDLLESLIL